MKTTAGMKTLKTELEISDKLFFHMDGACFSILFLFSQLPLSAANRDIRRFTRKTGLIEIEKCWLERAERSIVFGPRKKTFAANQINVEYLSQPINRERC